ncbi:MAG: YkgJ family cysteine cluster protein [Desulfuromonadales bacterium]
MNQYRELLAEVDHWFATCLQSGGSTLACRAGCSACCRGLFDITLLDAWILKEAFSGLPPETRVRVLDRCQPRLVELGRRWPGLKNPYLLNALPEEEWTDMPEDDQTSCPLLSETGHCLVYPARPLTCRLHGLPNIDYCGEDFDGTVCTLHAGAPTSLPEHVLRWRFREIFTQEVLLFRSFSKKLTGKTWSELDTFIPLALLADYTVVDWHNFKL